MVVDAQTLPYRSATVATAGAWVIGCRHRAGLLKKQGQFLLMKITLLNILALFTPSLLWGQGGYSKIYDFDRPASAFFDLVYKKDTLSVFGVTYHDSIPNFQGILFTQMDTNGHILNHSVFFDSLGDDYVGPIGSRMIRLADNSGFALVSSLLKRSNGILMLLNSNGSKNKVCEFKDDESLIDYYKEVLELDDGFIICGTKINQDSRPGAFVMKTDRLGNKIWEKKFFNSQRRWYFNSIYLIDDNTLVLGISSTPPINTPISQLNAQTVILAIDSLGAQKWIWESPISLNEGSAIAIQKTNQGNWIYLSGRMELFPQQGYWTVQPKIIVRDSNFNLVFEKIVGYNSSANNYFADLLMTPDNNWITVGSMLVPSTPNTQSGWVYKFSNSGDSIWNRYDTVFYNSNSSSFHYPSGSVVLPSGSTIVCGQVDNYTTFESKSWAWLIKVDNDGCVDTFNCATVGTKIPNMEAELMIYPSPTSSYVYYNDKNNTTWEKIEVINIYGKVLYSTLMPQNQYLNLIQLPAGQYFIKFNAKKFYVIKKIIKI